MLDNELGFMVCIHKAILVGHFLFSFWLESFFHGNVSLFLNLLLLACAGQLRQVL